MEHPVSMAGYSLLAGTNAASNGQKAVFNYKTGTFESTGAKINFE